MTRWSTAITAVCFVLSRLQEFREPKKVVIVTEAASEPPKDAKPRCLNVEVGFAVTGLFKIDSQLISDSYCLIALWNLVEALKRQSLETKTCLLLACFAPHSKAPGRRKRVCANSYWCSAQARGNFNVYCDIASTLAHTHGSATRCRISHGMCPQVFEEAGCTCPHQSYCVFERKWLRARREF